MNDMKRRQMSMLFGRQLQRQIKRCLSRVLGVKMEKNCLVCHGANSPLPYQSFSSRC